MAEEIAVLIRCDWCLGSNEGSVKTEATKHIVGDGETLYRLDMCTQHQGNTYLAVVEAAHAYGQVYDPVTGHTRKTRRAKAGEAARPPETGQVYCPYCPNGGNKGKGYVSMERLETHRGKAHPDEPALVI